MKFQSENPLVCYFAPKGEKVGSIFNIKPEDVVETDNKTDAIMQVKFVECIDEHNSKYVVEKMRGIDGGMMNMSKSKKFEITLPSPDMKYQE